MAVNIIKSEKTRQNVPPDKSTRLSMKYFVIKKIKHEFEF